MKPVFLFSVGVILPALLLSGGMQPLQAQTQSSKDTAAAIVKQIRSEYEQINKAALTKKTVHWSTPDSCQPAYMEGNITYFYKNNQLVKIYSEGGEDHGEWKEEFYFREGQVFFIYQNNAYGGAANPVEFKYQNRYYFDKGKLVKTLQSKAEEQDSAAPARLVQQAIRLAAHTDKASVCRIMGCAE